MRANPDFSRLPTIAGMESATARLGLYDADRDDLLCVHFPAGANAGGVFTRSQTRSADIDWCRKALKDGGSKARALIVNSGNSNAFTGKAGLAKNTATRAAVRKLTACPEPHIFLSATGVIGEALPENLLANALPELWTKLGDPDWQQAARSIMTTDTVPKAACASIQLANTAVHLVGIAKGSGMIAPNMATMLAYIFTDAPLSARLCQSLLEQHVETSFNAISIDGDTSTSDTLMLFATGAAGGPEADNIDAPELAAFSAALKHLMQDLAIQIVRDGEGAEKLIEIQVQGASSQTSAKQIATSIANSPLVKTAIAAGDANWGRIMAAAGKSGAAFERDACVLYLGGVEIARNGGRSPLWSEQAASAALSDEHVYIRLDAGTGGEGCATVWTCDLTHGYIDINGHYRN